MKFNNGDHVLDVLNTFCVIFELSSVDEHPHDKVLVLCGMVWQHTYQQWEYMLHLSRRWSPQIDFVFSQTISDVGHIYNYYTPLNNENMSGNWGRGMRGEMGAVQ